MNFKIIDVKGIRMSKKITWIIKRVARSYALSILLLGQSISCAKVEQKVSGSGSWTEVVTGSSLSFDSVAVGADDRMLALDPRGQIYRLQEGRWVLTSCPPAIWVAVGDDGSEFFIDGKNDLYQIKKADKGSDNVVRVDGAPKMSTLVVGDSKNMWSSFKDKLSQCENGTWKDTAFDGSLVVLKGTKVVAIHSASGQVALMHRKKPVKPVEVKPVAVEVKPQMPEPEKPAAVAPIAPVIEVKKEEPKVTTKAPAKKAKKAAKKKKTARKKTAKKKSKKAAKKSTGKKSAKKKPIVRKSSARKTPMIRGSRSADKKTTTEKRSSKSRKSARKSKSATRKASKKDTVDESEQ